MSYSRQTQLTRRRVYNDRGRGLWPRRRQSLDWTNISADADERKGRRRRPGLPGSAANKPIRARIYRSRPSSSREIAPSAGDRLTTRRQAALLLRPIPMQNSQPMTQKKKRKKRRKTWDQKKSHPQNEVAPLLRCSSSRNWIARTRALIFSRPWAGSTRS